MTDRTERVRSFLSRQSGRSSLTAKEISVFTGGTTAETLKALRALEKEGIVSGRTGSVTSWKSGASPRAGTRRWTAAR